MLSRAGIHGHIMRVVGLFRDEKGKVMRERGGCSFCYFGSLLFPLVVGLAMGTVRLQGKETEPFI